MLYIYSKIKTLNFIAILIILLFTFCNAVFVKAQPVNTIPEVGLWATKENDGVFNIYACGQKLCGRFVGMQYTTSMPPDTKYGHSQCNFLMLRDFEQDKSGKRWRGTILDPRDEKSYNAKIWLTNKNELRLRGYLGISLFGETQVWHRFTGKIQPHCKLPD
ncbi:DUF2147 family (PDB:4INN) [Commensalibacter communis]|uniref:DUF2147 family n=1 Tax=Commensalibacter communis TaxID=2972786 RepID=A0A9W4XIL5_9PROT|nr:DUF2147 domain-containing protein [Commensalibacter communis]CAI3954426.1 DUF2147 family (PDB:4INN) [Commensalibacter communis]CAI3955727.1 DUF2147 family (PDB:4INN) [Commensalibacter communis]CAI3956088.1 DUF2147 family (PDB:4INN) [Commensalibacter communis]CAI3956671.1 DUF2147 family (PDB:4INN) [Commensalibacter communis]CAI3957574.1 DUF2147 family (PDB:4INN) [Commensalibacter communis]